MSDGLDELNKLFTSKSPEDVLQFYNHFGNAEQLISWMKNRPTAPMKIYEHKGEKDIVVVIPTTDHNGKLANNCKEIFKGLQIIFVESSGPFFNYGRSCNFALKHALNYNPKWIILSNDDVYKIDEISNLVMELLKLTNKNYDTVFINSDPDNYHSGISYIIRSGFLDKVILPGINQFFKKRMRLRKKYKIIYGVSGLKTIKSRLRLLLSNKLVKFTNIGDFSIFSSDFVQKNGSKIFDEVFINSYEDVYLSIFLNKNKKSFKVAFNLGSHVSSSLGSSKSNALRNIASSVYFNYLFKSEYS